jgi:plasmid stabilization system protein ParE
MPTIGSPTARKSLLARPLRKTAATLLIRIDPTLPEHLRFARAGQHFVVFVDYPEQVIIVDFLHSRSDLPRRLAALTDAGITKDH